MQLLALVSGELHFIQLEHDLAGFFKIARAHQKHAVRHQVVGIVHSLFISFFIAFHGLLVHFAPFFCLASFKRAIALHMLHIGLAGVKIRQKSHKNHLIFRINRSRRCVSAARSASGARASAASTCRSASA